MGSSSSAVQPAGAVAPTGVPAYSSAVMAGGTLSVSGTLDIDPATGKPPTDVKTGAKLVLDNIKRSVEDAGITMDDLVWVQLVPSSAPAAGKTANDAMRNCPSSTQVVSHGGVSISP